MHHPAGCVPSMQSCGNVPRPPDFVARKNFHADMQAFARAKGLDVLMVLSCLVKPKRSRQVLLYCVPGHETAYALAKSIVHDHPDIRPDVIEDSTARSDGALPYVYYEQQNVDASRKQVIPAMQRGFASSRL